MCHFSKPLLSILFPAAICVALATACNSSDELVDNGATGADETAALGDNDGQRPTDSDDGLAPDLAEAVPDSQAAAQATDDTASSQPVPEEAAGALPGPLSEERQAIFMASAEDPAPSELNASRDDLEGRHYLYCDELHSYVMYEHLRDLGGGYAGVGSDQTYLYAGWMKAELVWVTDYDPWIKRLHMAYAAFFEHAESPEEFVALWRRRNRHSSEDLIRSHFEGRPDVGRIVRVWRSARGDVDLRFTRLASVLEEAGVPGFINDAEQYDWVRNLVRVGRVRPMVANLLDDEGMVGIGSAARELGVPLRALYLSNAEEYWSYTDPFRENIYAQHFDERSVVLRAAASKRRNGDYQYHIQNAQNFQAWLREPYVNRRADVWERVRVENSDHYPVQVTNEVPFDR